MRLRSIATWSVATIVVTRDGFRLNHLKTVVDPVAIAPGSDTCNLWQSSGRTRMRGHYFKSTNDTEGLKI